ncbi:MAG: disulfide bond formation protein B [Micavibrio aeruginosavorus]|uniref:Disulfide bond formation protein B n=1 Tax=Micavibrio aeruginosavorus TaxID=349221 RepID=A0A2W5N0H0_9BACT|nr:MAG: disulfide bond formation protein B [Micavibrio aeruginosavorus]
MNQFLEKIAAPRIALPAFAIIATLALVAAFTSQYVYGLQPCVLCIYQRWPYGLIIVLGLLGALIGAKAPKSQPIFLGLITLTFAANAGIAFYHSGVERHWWKSFLEGCTIPVIEGNITDVLAQIAATPAARCDEIPWTDPVLGLSMANYNVIACLVLTMAALYTLMRRAS